MKNEINVAASNETKKHSEPNRKREKTWLKKLAAMREQGSPSVAEVALYFLRKSAADNDTAWGSVEHPGNMKNIPMLGQVMLACINHDEPARDLAISRVEPLEWLKKIQAHIARHKENPALAATITEEMTTNVDIAYSFMGAKHSLHIAVALCGLGENYLQNGQFDEAEPILIAAATIAETQLGWGPSLAVFMEPLVVLYIHQGSLKKAKAWHLMVQKMKDA